MLNVCISEEISKLILKRLLELYHEIRERAYNLKTRINSILTWDYSNSVLHWCPHFFDSELNKLAAPPTTTKCWITAAAKLLLSHSTINFNSLNPNSSLLLYLKMERVNKRDVSCRVVVLFKFWLPFVWTYLNWTRFWFRGSSPMWSLYWSENIIRAFYLEITSYWWHKH